MSTHFKLYFLPWIAAVCCLSLVVGCSPSDLASVSGKVVNHDGAPVVGAQLTARSAESGTWGSAVTDQEGRYSLSSAAEERGLPPGAYEMIIIEDRGDVDVPATKTIPRKYSDAATSGLSFSIKAGDEIVYDVTLDAK
jgi:hypothetical protein